MQRAVTKSQSRKSIERTPEVESLWTQHSVYILRFMATLVGPTADAEDLTQEVFLIAMRRLTENGIVVDRPRTWLCGIAVRVAANARRKPWFKGLFGVSPTLREEPLDTLTPEKRLADKQDCHALYNMLERLSEKKRVAFLMHEAQGFTCAEIAAVLGCPADTVFSRVRAARQEIMQYCEQEVAK